MSPPSSGTSESFGGSDGESSPKPKLMYSLYSGDDYKITQLLIDNYGKLINHLNWNRSLLKSILHGMCYLVTCSCSRFPASKTPKTMGAMDENQGTIWVFP